MRRRVIVAAACVALLNLSWLLVAQGAGAAPSYSQIEGDGSSWAYNAVSTWVADVNTKGISVNFTSTGSAQGRKDFANQTTDFGVTDIGFQGTDAQTGDSDTNLGRPYAYVPIAAGGTSFPYNLHYGNTRIDNLRLSSRSLALIFTNQIKFWDDQPIRDDNPGITLPHTPLVAVVHSEGSGSTAQFTRYLGKMFPDVWKPFDPTVFTGSVDDGQTEYFPRQDPQIAQNGSDQVINYITSSSGEGTIGYDEYSYAKLNDIPVAKVLNQAGYYTAPTQYNVAVALQAAVINTDPTSPDYLLQNLDNVYVEPDPPAYPISSYSYLIEPTGATTPSASSPDPEVKMSSSKRQTLADFVYYSICDGQAEIGPIGYSSLPYNLVTAGFDQVAKLKATDPSVDLSGRDITSCTNPTFDRGDLSKNLLVTLAPTPADCDRLNQPNCTGDEGLQNGNPSPTDTGNLTETDSGTNDAPTGNESGGSIGGGQTTASGAAAPGDGPTADPTEGRTTRNEANGSAQNVQTQLAAARINGPTGVLGPLAVAELILVIVAPVLLGQWLLRSKAKR